MKTKFTKLFTCVLGAVAVLCFSLAIMIGFMGNRALAMEQATIETTEIRTSYAVNTELNVPTVTLKSATGAEVQATYEDAILVYPDGIAYRALTHKLSQLGEYELIYTKDSLTASVKFQAVRKNFSVSSDFSTAEYVDELENSNLGKSGIKVDLADGDVFSYNVPINVYDYNVLDVIRAYPKISERANGTSGDVTVNAVYMTVRLVDCYDADNYIEFYLWAPTTGGFYTGAGASYQTLTGLEYSATEIAASNSKRIEYNGSNYRCHTITRYVEGAQYGASCGQSSFVGLCSVGGMNFQYNTVSNEITRQTKYLNNNGFEYVSETRVITDLDAPEICAKAKHEAFKGFTTGEVYLELESKLCKKSSIEIEIESIFGKEGTALLEEDFTETVAPVIKVDVTPTNDSGVNVPVGEEFTIPSATVFDANYLGNLKASVYYNYGEANQAQVYSKDGKFTPSREGTYTIEYTAVDAFGNVGVSVLKLNALNQPAIKIDENKVEKLYAGEMNYLPDQNAVNINGKLSVNIYAISPLGEKVVIDNTIDAFEPQVLGTYEIHYEFTDNVYKIDWAYEVECVNDHENIRFYDQISLPPYFVKNATYTLEDYYAYTIGTQGRISHLTDVYVSVDGAEEVKLSRDEVAKYKVTGSESVTIVYQYDDARTAPVTIEIIDVNYNTTTASATRMKYGDYAGYFVGDWTRVEANFTTLGFYFDGSKETEVITYANLVSLNNFQFTLAGSTPWTADYHADGSSTTVVDYTNYAKIEIKLTDYLNSNNTYTVSYEQKGTNLIYRAPGVETTYEMTDMSTVANTIQANRYKGVMINSNGITTDLPKFDGDRCILTITITGITGECAFGVRRVGNQAFNRSMGKPAEGMAYYGVLSGTLVQDSYYTITACDLTNVLHPVTSGSVLLKVLDPAGNPVKSVDGVLLNGVEADRDFTIQVTDVGFYNVTYIKTIATGESKEESYPINVTDTEKPVIEFADGLNETKLVTVQKGKRHYIRDFTVTDNIDTTAGFKLFYSIQVRDANNWLVRIINGVTVEDPYIVFTKPGYYKVYVFAADSAGNSSWAYYNVLVK